MPRKSKANIAPRRRRGHRGPDAFVEEQMSGALNPDNKARRILDTLARSGLTKDEQRMALRDAAVKLGVSIKTDGPKGQVTGDFEMPPELLTGGPSPAMDFMEALQRGDPAAERIIDEVGRQYEQHKIEEEFSLADQFVASTYALAKKWKLNAREQKMIEPQLSSYRIDMRKAHRFALDDDFTRYATEISSRLSSEKLLARLQYATLPYETTWIEFNLREKVRVMREIHGMDNAKFKMNEVAPRLGLIMHRLSDTEAICELAVESMNDDEMFLGTMICYFFSTRDDYVWKEGDGKRFGCKTMLVGEEELADVAAASMWGYAEAGKSTVLEKASQLRTLRLPSFLQRHGRVGYGRMYNIAAVLGGNKAKDLKVHTDKMAELVLHEIGEFAGMMRWVVVVLAMLNEVPVDARHVQPQGHVRTGLTNKRPKLDYHKVTLRLPKTEPLKYIERQIRTASRRRAHEVRSHWRTYLNDPHCAIDEHQWEYDHDEGYRLCGKCLSYGRLIHEHIRGDASLGWVRHDYVIKPSKQT